MLHPNLQNKLWGGGADQLALKDAFGFYIFTQKTNLLIKICMVGILQINLDSFVSILVKFGARVLVLLSSKSWALDIYAYIL